MIKSFCEKNIAKFLSFFKITHSLKKASNYNIIKAKVDTINEKIAVASQKSDFNHTYKSKIKSVTENITKNLDLWKSLELRYKSSKIMKIGTKSDYRKKVRLYKLEIQKSLSTLMVLLINIKNLV